MRHLNPYIVILCWLSPLLIFGQSISATYTLGDIPTSYQRHDPLCNGPSNQLVISLDAPGTFTVTGIDASWDFEALEPGLISHQASRLYFVNSSIQSDRFSQEIGEPGVHTYTMTNDPLINGTYEGPVDLVFELWAWRRDEISEEDGCGTRFNKVNDRSWTLTVHYTYSPPTLANIYLGGNGDGYDHDFKTGLNPYVPPALASIYHGGSGDGYDHDFQMGLNPYMPPTLASIYRGGSGDGYDHVFQTGLNPYVPPALASIYRGGVGDGYDLDFHMGINPYVPPALASIYCGGAGDGYDIHYVRFLNPNCQDMEVFWTGATDTNWFNLSNWDCNNLPSPSSHVIIARDVPHYPYVTGDDVIAGLTLQHNTTIRFSNNILFSITSN